MRTDLVNEERKAATERAMRGAVALMQSEGISLDSEEGAAVAQLLGERLAVLNAEHEDTATLAQAAANAVFDVVDSVRAASACRFVEALGAAGREAVERAILLGGYASAPAGAMEKMNTRLGQLVANVLLLAASREDAIQRIREGSTEIVREVFGPAPAPSRMN